MELLAKKVEANNRMRDDGKVSGALVGIREIFPEKEVSKDWVYFQ